MGRNSMSDWSWAIDQHRKKGHKIIRYPEADRKETPDPLEIQGKPLLDKGGQARAT